MALAFLSGSFGPIPYPKKSLVGYQRVSGLGAGKSVTAQFDLKVGDLARADEKGNMVLWPGSYRIDVEGGTGWSFTLTGTKAMLDEWPQPS